MACTSRMDARRCRRTIRSRAVGAVPLSRPAPYTRYTTCRSSTITMGSATAVPRLRAPEQEEADDQRGHRPARPVQPQRGLGHGGMAVGAVIHEVLAAQVVVVQGAHAGV